MSEPFNSPNPVRGGRPIYGATLGILMLDARFPRIPGDMGHAATFAFPVQYRLVEGASPQKVVREGAPDLLQPFIDAARDLVRHGCEGITTNCGFLSLFQAPLSAAIGRPVAASSLMQAPLVERLLPPGQRVGILTISGSTLTPEHLSAAGVAADTPIGSTEGGQEFTRAILGDELDLNVSAALEDNVSAAVALCEAHPEIGALVLECTNMTPYAPAIRRAIQRPVFTMVDFVNWFHASLATWPAREAP